MTEAIGWAASILFAFSGLPQALMSIRQGHSRGISNGLVGMWFLGESLAIVYASIKGNIQPLLFNYVLNYIFLCIIIWYKFFPRRDA